MPQILTRSLRPSNNKTTIEYVSGPRLMLVLLSIVDRMYPGRHTARHTAHAMSSSEPQGVIRGRLVFIQLEQVVSTGIKAIAQVREMIVLVPLFP